VTPPPTQRSQDHPATTRFAPSPSGHLHLGHAFAAFYAHTLAGVQGRFLLRLEDIDGARCRPEFEASIRRDLEWLGLAPAGAVWRQSERLPAYAAALDRLRSMGLVYPCFCTRAEIRAEVEGSARAPHGPEGALYPGICRRLSPAEAADRIAVGAAHAWRLDSAAAAAFAGTVRWRDLETGSQVADAALLGDAVLARKDVPTSYHLAVVMDDAAQGVTLVTRGEDLRYASHLHRLLQALLDLPVPDWRHHPILLRADGKRLAKRDRALTIRELQAGGWTPGQVLALARNWAERGPPPEFRADRPADFPAP